MSLLIRIVLNTITVVLAALILPGVQVDGLLGAFLVAVVLILLNTFFKPILQFVALPITALTLGLFLFVINAVIILIASEIVVEFSVENFWWALLFSVVLSILNSMFEKLEGGK